jgi:hypothetical protein
MKIMAQFEWPKLEAAVAEMTDEEKLRLLALVTSNLGHRGGLPADRPSLTEFDLELAKVAEPSPPLPADFSRADIYIDHD